MARQSLRDTRRMMHVRKLQMCRAVRRKSKRRIRAGAPPRRAARTRLGRLQPGSASRPSLWDGGKSICTDDSSETPPSALVAKVSHGRGTSSAHPRHNDPGHHGAPSGHRHRSPAPFERAARQMKMTARSKQSDRPTTLKVRAPCARGESPTGPPVAREYAKYPARPRQTRPTST